MQTHHWLMIALFVLIGYFIGVKYPSTGVVILSKVGM